MDFAAYIDSKDAETLALALGVAVGTIYSYRCRNIIPRKRWDALMAWDRKLKYPALVEMEATSNSAVA